MIRLDIISSEQDVRDVLEYMVSVLGTKFHPDDPVHEYEQFGGGLLFTESQADYLEDLLNQCYTYCEEHNLDIYEMTNEIL